MDIKKSNIYTKGGDKGETSLFGGARVSKDSLSVDLYGEVDTLNSMLSYGRSLIANYIAHDKKDEIVLFLIEIQKELFKVSSFIATPIESWLKFKLPALDESITLDLEKKIDYMDATLPKLTAFIIPGSGMVASQIHQVRCQTRQVERKLVTFINETGSLVPVKEFEIMNKFFNRLSDYFFMLGRYIDFLEGKDEIKI